jgi:4-amino-4-deoxy-L-arabinose transferase-like glycosyltransferase
MTHRQIMPKDDQTTFFPVTLLGQLLLLGFLFVTALGIRLIELKRLPDDFHPTRQYWSALLARAFYLETQQSVPAWEQEVVEVQQEKIGVLEPPVFEFIVAQSYNLIGKEVLWIARLYAILFWLIAGIVVYRIGRELGSVDAAVLATSFFLFVPFGIRASRSFQPDMLMLMLLTGTLFLVLRWHNQPSWTRIFWAGIVGGATILVKPQGFFMLVVSALALLGFQDGQKRRQTIVFLILTILPAMLYYGHEFLVNPAMNKQVQSSFVPSLWFELFYWQYWLKHLWRVIGFSALVGGMLGVLLATHGWRRNFLIGMWLGYFIFGLFYSYHIYTHDYYHLQFIPAVALALGLLGEMVLQKLVLVKRDQLTQLVTRGILIFSVFLNIGLYLNSLAETENTSSQARLDEQIGVLVKHSTHTLFLAPYYGYPLQYYGRLAGEAWPTVGDINAEQVLGQPTLTAVERFEQIYQPTSPDYFIITDMDEYSVQIDLQALLTARFPVLHQSENLIIFNLHQQ